LAGRLYREFKQQDQFATLAIEGLAFEFLAESSRRATCPASGSPPAWLLRVRDLLQSCCTEPFELEKIARDAGVHPVHLIRSFRRHFGTTPADYARTLRVERSRQLLVHSKSPLAEIAVSVGFADQSHFTRTFRRFMGVTPAVYRRETRSS
jgi:AraC family transcriptional regulator